MKLTDRIEVVPSRRAKGGFVILCHGGPYRNNFGKWLWSGIELGWVPDWLESKSALIYESAEAAAADYCASLLSEQ